MKKQYFDPERDGASDFKTAWLGPNRGKSFINMLAEDNKLAVRSLAALEEKWFRQKPHDPDAPYDGYDESDGTEEKARTVRLQKQNRK